MDLQQQPASYIRNWLNTHTTSIPQAGSPTASFVSLRHPKICNYPQIVTAHGSAGGIYFAPREICASEYSPMNKTVEIVLTALTVAGMYCAMPKGVAPVGNPVIQTQQSVLMADGSDPIPFCRHACK
jgi:hypothetical protein